MLVFKNFVLRIFEWALSATDGKKITAKFALIKPSIKNMLKSKKLDWIIINNKFINSFHVFGVFLYPQKTSETRGFLIFSGGIERDSGMKWAKVTAKELLLSRKLTE